MFTQRILYFVRQELLKIRYMKQILFTKKPSQMIDGWMSDAELNWIRQNVIGAKKILEIGSWKGRSTAAIIEGMDHDAVLVCIDTWRGSDNEEIHNIAKDASDPIWREFYTNHKKNIDNGKIVTMRMSSKDALEKLENNTEQFDCIFIDADHSYEACKADIKGSLRVLKNDGLLCGHDYMSWPGVTKAVDEMCGVSTEIDSVWKKLGQDFSLGFDVNLTEIPVMMIGSALETPKNQQHTYWNNSKYNKNILPHTHLIPFQKSQNDGVGYSMGHLATVQSMSEYPSLLAENDFVKTQWYSDIVYNIPKGCDILWLGYFVGSDHVTFPTVDSTCINNNYWRVIGENRACHSMLICTEKGKNTYLKAAQKSLSDGAKIPIDVILGRDFWRECDQYIIGKQYFYQPGYLSIQIPYESIVKSKYIFLYRTMYQI